MGRFDDGIPLTWAEGEKHVEYSRNQALQEFINVYNIYKDRFDKELKWGDEIEYSIVHFQDKNKCAQLALKASSTLEKIIEYQTNHPHESTWHHEYTEYMLEGIPKEPFGGNLADFKLVEQNMSKRRTFMQSFLLPNEFLFSTNFPRLGCPSFSLPEYSCKPDREDGYLGSKYIPDEIITNRSMYKNPSRMMKSRRGKNLFCDVKVFRDENTKVPLEDRLPDKPDAVHLDCIAFGMGNCCLQVTFQAPSFTAARILYDHFAPFAPIMLALTASTPIYRGYLVDSDCRWNVTKTVLDDSTKEEQMRARKLRYDSISLYMSPDGEKYNDVPFEYDKKIYQRLRDEGFDHLVAQYQATWLTYDAVTFIDTENCSHEEENLYYHEIWDATVWPSLKFKPPPKASIGWRVEFRTMEPQITDFESAAFGCFVNLVARLILHNGLNFLIPISKVDENMANATKRDAINTEKFWFRKNIDKLQNQTNNGSIYDDCELMTLNQIVNGNDFFPGLISLIQQYVSSMHVDVDTQNLIQIYLELIKNRASGKLLTAASWIRKEVLNHPGYKKDSVITDEINYDLLTKMKKVQDKLIKCPEFLGL